MYEPGAFITGSPRKGLPVVFGVWLFAAMYGSECEELLKWSPSQNDPNMKQTS